MILKYYGTTEINKEKNNIYEILCVVVETETDIGFFKFMIYFRVNPQYLFI